VNTTSWEITASKKVDDLSRHESRHDSDPKPDPKRNAREKAPGWTKPGEHPPQGETPRDGDARK
jgi:hypothetical protein